MSINAKLPGGLTLSFPPGTPDEEVDRRVAQHIAATKQREDKHGETMDTCAASMTAMAQASIHSAQALQELVSRADQLLSKEDDAGIGAALADLSKVGKSLERAVAAMGKLPAPQVKVELGELKGAMERIGRKLDEVQSSTDALRKTVEESTTQIVAAMTADREIVRDSQGRPKKMTIRMDA